MTYFQVVRALAVGESRVLRAYARAGKIMIATPGPLLDEALEIVADVQKLGGFERSLLKTASAPVTAAVA